jgi:flagellar protein FliS
MSLNLSRNGRARYQAVNNTGAVLDRPPIDLVVLVYERIDDKLLLAEQAVAANNPAQLGEQMQQATDLLQQGLVATLDFERGGDVALNLGRVYDYCQRRMLQGHLRRDVEALREVRKLLAELREGWVGIQQGKATA